MLSENLSMLSSKLRQNTNANKPNTLVSAAEAIVEAAFARDLVVA